MYRIGDFSKASKTTIKTLRYYEKDSYSANHVYRYKLEQVSHEVKQM